MKDFRFNDYSEESYDDEEESTGYNQLPGEKKRIIKFVIIAVVSLVAGLSVYLITDALINSNRNPVVVTPEDTELDVNDEMVKYLYDNITYTVSGLRNDKFFKTENVTIDDFTTQEKFYYALRYAVASDFIDMTVDEVVEEAEEETTTTTEDQDSEKKEEDNTKVEKKFATYSISNSTISEYMYNFFGEDVTYSTDSPVSIAVNFKVDGYNAGILNYDATSDSFLIQFDSISESALDKPLNPYLYKIDSAMREGETSNIIIKEKVVFTDVTQKSDEAGNLLDSYDYKIFYDYSMSNLIEEKAGVTKNDLISLGIENYKESALVISYTFFKDDNDEYHFLSSKIED